MYAWLPGSFRHAQPSFVFNNYRHHPRVKKNICIHLDENSTFCEYIYNPPPPSIQLNPQKRKEEKKGVYTVRSREIHTYWKPIRTLSLNPCSLIPDNSVLPESHIHFIQTIPFTLKSISTWFSFLLKIHSHLIYSCYLRRSWFERGCKWCSYLGCSAAFKVQRECKNKPGTKEV